MGVDILSIAMQFAENMNQIEIRGANSLFVPDSTVYTVLDMKFDLRICLYSIVRI